MKKALISSLVALFAIGAYADIQSPPMADQGPTRKLGRGIANIAYGWVELEQTPALMNTAEGNSAAFSYGIVKGIGRTLARFGSGVYDVVTFPFPTYKGSYRTVLPGKIPWIHGGYEEFPPELGWDSRLIYCTETSTAY
jgi:putative exosortase-associated protein (TIGR04073 family)